MEDEEQGFLIIHRDIPGSHTDGIDCWCEPFIIKEDTIKTPQQIVEEVSIKKFLN
jgi:hypothetical protein